jgi:hypothetical protein
MPKTVAELESELDERRRALEYWEKVAQSIHPRRFQGVRMPDASGLSPGERVEILEQNYDRTERELKEARIREGAIRPSERREREFPPSRKYRVDLETPFKVFGSNEAQIIVVDRTAKEAGEHAREANLSNLRLAGYDFTRENNPTVVKKVRIEQGGGGEFP